MIPDTKSFRGSFLLFRKVPTGLRRTAGGSRMPSFRHPSFASAEAEAQRLLGLFPESSFVIMQEVARVKMKGAEPDEIRTSAPARDWKDIMARSTA